jgi:uncharacterized membrane protein YedE/YeeE
MKRQFTAFSSGLLFAIGLALSGMTRPSKVLGFLDVTGRWDPSLALVMAGAVAVYASAIWVSRRMHRPVAAESFVEPSASRPDAPLVIGAIIFGAGWALVGYCPGPAFSALGAGIPQAVPFVAAMTAGMWFARIVRARMSAEPKASANATSELAFQLDETG